MKLLLSLIILATVIHINDDVQIVRGTYDGDKFIGHMISKADGWRIDFTHRGYKTSDGNKNLKGHTIEHNKAIGKSVTFTGN